MTFTLFLRSTAIKGAKRFKPTEWSPESEDSRGPQEPEEPRTGQLPDSLQLSPEVSRDRQLREDQLTDSLEMSPVVARDHLQQGNSTSSALGSGVLPLATDSDIFANPVLPDATQARTCFLFNVCSFVYCGSKIFFNL
jgi:hypothetical protein